MKTSFGWKHALFLLVAVVVVQQGASYLGKISAEHHNEAERRAKPAAEIRVVVSRQDSEGATHKDLDLQALKKLETYTLETTKQRIKENLERQGLPPHDFNLKSESNYVERPVH